MEIILHILFRALSGSANASFYGGKRTLGITACLLFSVLSIGFAFTGLPWYATVLFVFSGLSAIGKMYGFFNGSNIHLWENLVMLPIPVGLILSGGSFILVALSMYPGLFLHKMLINFGSGIPVFDNQTDDPTGKTYGIPIPSWVPVFGNQLLKVPRTTQKLRLIVSIVCLILCAVYFFLPKIILFGFVL